MTVLSYVNAMVVAIVVATAMCAAMSRRYARLDAWNARICRVRVRIKKIFGIWKRCGGLRRLQWPDAVSTPQHAAGLTISSEFIKRLPPAHRSYQNCRSVSLTV